MRAHRRIRCFVGLVFALGLAAQAGDDAARTRPGFGRDGAPRPSVSRPSTPALPDVLAFPETDPATPQAARAATGRGTFHAIPPGILQARREAEEAATRAAARARRQYYLSGYRDGLRAAVVDESLGRWDYVQGLRLGRLDPGARGTGRIQGRDAAIGAAADAAQARVELQFRDLSRNPLFDPVAPALPYEPSVRWTDDVVLDDLWLLLPDPADAPAAARFAEARAGTAYRPRDLYEMARGDALIDRSWIETAYETSAARTRPPVASNGAPARDDLREEFDRAYRARIATEYRRTVRPAYDAGFADGWDHGARIRYEWSFRLGYARGFDETAAAESRRAFLDTFPRAYRSSYAEEYDGWWRTPRPEIVSVAWTDANRDGVLQPGESLVVDYEVANYGGADAIVEAVLAADRLQTAPPVLVTLPARSVTRAPAELRAAVPPSTPARTRAVVAVLVGDLRADLDLDVRWPLELTGAVRLANVRALDGAARLEIEVVNRANRPLDAAVRLDGPVAARVAGLGQPGVVRPGKRALAYVELEGLRPLDLLGGGLETGLSAYAGGERQDARPYRFPELAVDLDRADLLDYLARLAGNSSVSRADVAEARRLLARRLRADWDRAVRSNGNPYKRDLLGGTTETALGELVRLRELQGAAAARGPVFAGLDVEVEALASDLPGVHPFLRKSMRKLARKLG